MLDIFKMISEDKIKNHVITLYNLNTFSNNPKIGYIFVLHILIPTLKWLISLKKIIFSPHLKIVLV